MGRGICSLLLLPLLLGLSLVSSSPTRRVSCDGSLDFECHDGSKCIPRTWLCDQDSDCPDSSDERDCDVLCPGDQFRCGDNSMCIDRGWVCDQDPDCPDASDERDCYAPCIVPSEIENAWQNSTLPGTLVAHGSLIWMECKANFVLVHRRPSICYNGTWRHYHRCQPGAPCIVPSELRNGWLADPSLAGTLVAHGMSVEVECLDLHGVTFIVRGQQCNNGTLAPVCDKFNAVMFLHAAAPGPQVHVRDSDGEYHVDVDRVLDGDDYELPWYD